MLDEQDVRLYDGIIQLIPVVDRPRFVAGYNDILNNLLEEEPNLNRLLAAGIEQIRIAKNIIATGETFTATDRNNEQVEVTADEGQELYKQGVLMTIMIAARLTSRGDFVEMSEDVAEIVADWRTWLVEEETPQEEPIEEPNLDEADYEAPEHDWNNAVPEYIPDEDEEEALEIKKEEEPTKNKQWKFKGW